MKRIWIKEKIEEAVKNSNNLRQCLLNLGVDPRSNSRNTLKKKIEKCTILCANCHRLYHHNKRKEKYE